MKDKISETNLLNEFNGNNNEYKCLNIKLIIIFSFILLFLIGFIIMIIFLIHQSDKINELTNQIKNFSNKFDQNISFLKNETNYISVLNYKINNAEMQLKDKYKEIQSFKEILEQKDKEIKSFNRNINNLNVFVQGNMDNIEKSLKKNENEIELLKNCSNNINNLNKLLKEKDDEIEILKNFSNELNNSNLIIYNSINNLENEVKEKEREIEIIKDCSNNLSILNDKIKKTEIKLNENFAELQEFKILESNLALLIDFKIRIKADFYIENNQLYLCSQKVNDFDKIDDSRVKLNANIYQDGCIWIVHQNRNFFEFTATNSKYGLNGWKIQIKNNNVICTNVNIGSTFTFEEGSLYKYYKIKNTETNQYLFINVEKKRDKNSYFIDLTNIKDLATDFSFSIFYE